MSDEERAARVESCWRVAVALSALVDSLLDQLNALRPPEVRPRATPPVAPDASPSPFDEPRFGNTTTQSSQESAR
jgi:hypothetical protein